MFLVANAVRYGAAQGEWVLNAVRCLLLRRWFLNAFKQTVVLSSGEVIKTQLKTFATSCEFDTTKLFTGVEGTLGIIISEGIPIFSCPLRSSGYWNSFLFQVMIGLSPVLPTTVAVVQFPNVRKATEAVVGVMNTGMGNHTSSTLRYHRRQTEIYFTKMVN